jgi:hypothetical protein
MSNYLVLSSGSEATLDDLRTEFVRSAFAYPTPLPAELYDRAKSEGFEMTGYYVRGRLAHSSRYDVHDNVVVFR